MRLTLTLVYVTSLCLGYVPCQGKELLSNNETEALEFLKRYNAESTDLRHDGCVAAFNYATNITAYNAKVKSKLGIKSAKLTKEFAKQASEFDVSDSSSLSNDTIRQLKFIQNIGTAGQTNLTKLEQLNNVSIELNKIYDTGNVCLKNDKCHDLEPGLTRIMAKSREFDQLLNAWKGWRDATGPKMKHLYEEYTDLKNEALKISGYSDAGEYWRSSYETPTFEEDVRKLFEQIRPLYEHLHGYVRRRLKDVYGEDKFPSTGHIPAHLLGNMWAQGWQSILDLVVPYKGRPSLDITKEMINQNYTVEKMFRTAENFYESLGLEPMMPSYWKESMFTKPTDGRAVQCHASAWDCRDKKDFRVKMCADVTHEDLMTIHHEMGHTVYSMAYRNLPQVYKDGANPGFHEAIDDVMTLSVQTPEHLEKIGLLENFEDDKKTDINFLMNMALDQVAFLPFGYLIDQWRWSVFRGDTKPDEYNSYWWDLRCRYQGVSSPIPRNENDFDPGAKHHVASGTPYIRKMLEMGRSKPWPDAMEVMTGQRKMDAGAILQYFRPLFEFLRKENGNDYGWNPQCPEMSTKKIEETKGKGIEKCDNNGQEKVNWSLGIFLSLIVALAMISQRAT